jgi:chemotaxis protein histidine kinase CheA
MSPAEQARALKNLKRGRSQSNRSNLTNRERDVIMNVLQPDRSAAGKARWESLSAAEKQGRLAKLAAGRAKGKGGSAAASAPAASSSAADVAAAYRSSLEAGAAYNQNTQSAIGKREAKREMEEIRQQLIASGVKNVSARTNPKKGQKLTKAQRAVALKNLEKARAARKRKAKGAAKPAAKRTAKPAAKRTAKAAAKPAAKRGAKRTAKAAAKPAAKKGRLRGAAFTRKMQAAKAAKAAGKSTSKRGAKRKNAYVAAPGIRANMYVTRPNGEVIPMGSRPNGRRRRRGKSHRKNAYVRRNGGLQMALHYGKLFGIGALGFMVTNVATHYISNVEFAKGAIADYGVPAALLAATWMGPTSRMITSHPGLGRSAQIAITAGVVGSLVNRLLDNMLLKNIAELGEAGGTLRSIGENTAAVLGGWPLVDKSKALSVGLGEYVYDLPDAGVSAYHHGMGRYITDNAAVLTQTPRVAQEPFPGLGYVDLEARAANWAALEAANIKATQPEVEAGGMFDDQFASAY